MKELSKKVQGLKPSGIRKFFDLVLNAKDIISLGVGEPDYPTPWNITEQAIYYLENGYTSYTSNHGLLSFREEIAKYNKNRFGSNYDPAKEIMITMGVSEGLDIAFRALINPEDEIIIPTPSYVSYEPLITLAGGTPVTINTAPDNFVLTKDKLLDSITDKTKALLLSYPNNPTGAALTEQELKDIIEIVKEKDLYLISDEVYTELTYEEKPLSASTYLKDNLILLNGLSKSHAMTGWRIAWICAPEIILEQLVKIHQYNALCAPIMSQYAGIEALKNGSKAMQSMKDSYEKRRNFFYYGLKGIGFDVLKPKGAFYIFPGIKKFGLKAEDFAIRLLKEQKVAVVPGDAFGDGLDDYLRMCYACSIEDLKEALLRIEKFVKSLK